MASCLGRILDPVTRVHTKSGSNHSKKKKSKPDPSFFIRNRPHKILVELWTLFFDVLYIDDLRLIIRYSYPHKGGLSIQLIIYLIQMKKKINAIMIFFSLCDRDFMF